MLAVYNSFDSTKNSWARQEESLVDGVGVHTIFFSRKFGEGRDVTWMDLRQRSAHFSGKN